MRRNAIASIILAAACMAPAAQAQFLERGWTLELAYGQTKFKDAGLPGLDGLTREFFGGFDLPVQTLTSTVDTKSRSWAVLGGYRVNAYLAGEAGFYNLGSFQYFANGTVSDSGLTRPAAFWLGYRTKGILIGGVGTLPLGRFFELRARAGLSNTSTRIRYSATVEGDTLADHFSDTSQDIYYGVGAAVNVWDYYRVGLDWLRHANAGKSSTTGSSDIDNLMLSIAYRY